MLMNSNQATVKDPFKTISAENHYCSVSKLSYQNLGNPLNIMAKLDDQRSQDLRRSHFNVGKESQ